MKFYNEKEMQVANSGFFFLLKLETRDGISVIGYIG